MPSLTVNTKPLSFRMDPQTPLLWALRDGANLTGTKYGCGTGDCGACMVLVDGEAQPSCMISLAEAEGRSVVTIEGLSKDRSHPVQQALIKEQAIQCGFCTPGIVISAAAQCQPQRCRYQGRNAKSVPLRGLSPAAARSTKRRASNARG
jgi:isoquinoline 1-oxidoreductase subunit alpha